MASLWLHDRHKSLKFASVSPPPIALGKIWSTSTAYLEPQFWHWPLALFQILRLICALEGLVVTLTGAEEFSPAHCSSPKSKSRSIKSHNLRFGYLWASLFLS